MIKDAIVVTIVIIIIILDVDIHALDCNQPNQLLPSQLFTSLLSRMMSSSSRVDATEVTK